LRANPLPYNHILMGNTTIGGKTTWRTTYKRSWLENSRIL